MNSNNDTTALSDNYPLAHRLSRLGAPPTNSIPSVDLNSVIDLASGSPIVPTPQVLKESAVRAIEEDQNRAVSTVGDLELRNLIANMYTERLERPISGEDELTITNGTSSAINAVIFATINPGDEVIVFEPFFWSYIRAIELAGGVPKIVRLNPKDWSIPLSKLENAFSKKTKLVILNTPHNPSGSIPSIKVVSYLLDLCEEFGAVVLSDEIYSNIVLEGSHISPLSIDGVDPNRVIVVDGLSKAFNASGWRIGYILASKQYTASIRLVQSTFGLTAPNPLQIAAREAYKPSFISGSWVQETVDVYRHNLNLLFDAVTKAGMTAVRPKGSTFIFADAANFRTEEQNPRDAFLKRTGILTLSGDVCLLKPPKNGSNYLRICFARDTDLIEQAVAKIANL